uniref:Uncharacterized protein n=1 Tax=viral metagenome TaxID=1070528 RepID=A0A6C0EZB1_9ZZZZ
MKPNKKSKKSKPNIGTLISKETPINIETPMEKSIDKKCTDSSDSSSSSSYSSDSSSSNIKFILEAADKITLEDLNFSNILKDQKEKHIYMDIKKVLGNKSTKKSSKHKGKLHIRS